MTHQPRAKPSGRSALIALLAKDINYRDISQKYEIRRKEVSKE